MLTLRFMCVLIQSQPHRNLFNIVRIHVGLMVVCFFLYCTFTGETEFQIGDVRRPITTWLTLSDSRHNISPFGELMFSLSYLPTAERLTVVVVKARNLKLNEDDPNNSQQNVFVKVIEK